MSKIELLNEHGVGIDRNFVEKVVLQPDRVERGYKGRFIAQKGLDKEHVIRVIYEVKSDCIFVITLYPGRRKRYEKDQI